MRQLRLNTPRTSPGPVGWLFVGATFLASAIYLAAWLSEINAKCHAGTYLGYACAIVQTDRTAGMRAGLAEPTPVEAKPAALQHSFSVWPSGSISDGETRTISTRFGDLSCTSGQQAGAQTVSNGARVRTCWWN